jgi:hypothetical protein
MRPLLLATCLALPALLAARHPARAADLTLHRVMLSAAGVGYFEFNAQADGPTSLGLDLPLDDVDDVLNSLAVFDDHGGVGSIDLPSRDNAHQAFSDVPFAQAMLNSPADLLTSLRGESITVTGPDAMVGRIVSALPESIAVPKDNADSLASPATHTRVTLLTEDGLRQFILEDADSVQATDPALRARIAAALAAARQQTAASMRHLTLRSTGDGARTISVGYVTAAPLWKATYRLILPENPGAKARVQGWAVLENQSAADWKDVDLTLHAGNPVTFHQAIYASYYAERPDVPVEVLGRLLPDTDQRETAIVVQEQRPLFRQRHATSSSGTSWRGAVANAPPPPLQDYIPPPQVAVQAANQPVFAAPEALAPAADQTEAAETAIDTSFHIATPIDLARGHSAVVPILDEPMQAEQLDWLQPQSTRPIAAIRLTNTGNTGLPAGALTLYTASKTGTEFAGDARLSGLPAGETRMLGFAEDLRTTAARGETSAPDKVLHLTVARGVIRRVTRSRHTYTVTLTAPAREARRIVIEFANIPRATFSIEGGAPSPVEETSAAWRVTLDLKPNETRTLTAYADTVDSSEQSLLSDGSELNNYLLMMISMDGNLDEAGRAKLQPLFDLRDALSVKQNELQRLTARRSDVDADEGRIRNNLRVVNGPGDLHEKLLGALAADETQLASLKTGIAAAQSTVDAAHAALADAVSKLEL